MKSAKFNRILIGVALVYFPIAAIGYTGSFWAGLQELAVLIAVISLGITEGKNSAALAAQGDGECAS